MNIVILNYGFPPWDIGGAETYTKQIAQTLQERGHSVRIICFKTRGPYEGFYVRDEFREGFHIVRISFPSEYSSRYRILPKLAEWAFKWLQDVSADIIYAGMFWQLLAVLKGAEGLRIPIVLVVHGYDLFCHRCNLVTCLGDICIPPVKGELCWYCALGYAEPKHLSLLRMAYWLSPELRRIKWEWSSRMQRFTDLVRSVKQMKVICEWLCQYASGIVCPSRYSYEQHQNSLPKHSSIYHVPNGTDCRRFKRNRSLPSQNNGKYIFSYLGRIDPLKGIDTARKAVKGLPRNFNMEFRVYGDLNHPWYHLYSNELRDLAKGDERIRFCGLVKEADLMDAYEHMSALVLPSVTENLSITIQEALASHRPVICSTAGGNTEMVIDNVNGLTFPPGDITALRNAMMRILKEPGLLERLASNARPYQDIRDSAAELEKIFEQAITNRG